MNTNRTFIELQNAIKTEMQLDPGLISDEERKSFINKCIAEVGGIGLFEKVVTLPIVNGKVDIPDDLTGVIELRYGGRALFPTKRRSANITSDAPIAYILMYNVVELFPTLSNGEVELHYSYRPAHLVNDDDRPDIPNGFDSMIVDYSVGHAHRKNGNVGLYREYMGGYNETKTILVAELIKRVNSRVVTQHNTEYMDTPATPWDFI